MEPLEIVVPALIFAAVGLAVFVLLRRAWEPRDVAVETTTRPELAVPPGAWDQTPLGGLTPVLMDMVPMTAAGRATLYREVRDAGYYSPTAFPEYLAQRNMLILLVLIVTGGLFLAVDAEQIPLVAALGLLAAMAVFAIPRALMTMRARARARQIERGLPVAIDLINLGLSGGLNVLGALQRVSRDLRFSYPVLAEELDIVCRQAELRSLETALDEFAERVPVPEAKHLAQILAQSQRLGTDATVVLTETSDNLRVTMRQRAESQANRASFWLLLPTITCFLMAAVLVLIGPVILEMRREMLSVRDIMRENRRGVEKLTPPEDTFGAQPQ